MDKTTYLGSSFDEYFLKAHEEMAKELAEAREVIEKVAKPIQKTVYRYGSMSDRDDPPYPVTETVDKDDAKEARAFLAKYPKGEGSSEAAN